MSELRCAKCGSEANLCVYESLAGTHKTGFCEQYPYCGTKIEKARGADCPSCDSKCFQWGGQHDEVVARWACLSCSLWGDIAGATAAHHI